MARLTFSSTVTAASPVATGASFTSVTLMVTLRRASITSGSSSSPSSSWPSVTSTVTRYERLPS